MLKVIKSIYINGFEVQLQKQTKKVDEFYKCSYHVEVLNSSYPTGLNSDMSRFWLKSKRDAQAYFQSVARDLGGDVC